MAPKQKLLKELEDREKFKFEMAKVRIDTAKGGFVKSFEDAKIIGQIKFPIIIRPSFTMGGLEDQLPITKKNLKVYGKRFEF